MKSVHRLAMAALSALATACASVAPHYHTLLPALAGGESAAPTSLRKVDVESVRIPAQVDRLELVVRRRDGGIALSDTELWIAPLTDELKSSLSVEIERQLVSENAERLARSTSPLSVRIDVERFESAPSRYAFIGASWQLRQTDAAHPMTIGCRTEALERVGKGYGELVRGHQRAVVVIADQIAAAARQLATDRPAICP
jgi:uncharacterized lipoprotein YmbA